MIDLISTKPLVRWTIGPVHPAGFRCLYHAVNLFAKVYPQFDRMVCFNNLNHDQKKRLNKLDAELIDATTYPNTLVVISRGPAWKLRPPRMRPHAHELIIDNDLVIFDKIPTVDEFLHRNVPMVSFAASRSLGVYNKFVKSGLKINSGLIGLPPDFDFGEKLNGFISQALNPAWKGHFDEQGAVAAALCGGDYLLISMAEVGICKNFLRGSYAHHFCGLNCGRLRVFKRFLRKHVL